jgi:hypothetical protein
MTPRVNKTRSSLSKVRSRSRDIAELKAASSPESAQRLNSIIVKKLSLKLILK